MHGNQIRIGSTKSRHPEYKTITCTTQSSPWSALSPYIARRANGEIMENSWQFRKIYRHISKRIEYYSRWDKTIVWQWHEDTHLDSNNIPTDSYWTWRDIGLNNPYPVRYPGGVKNRHNCFGFIDDEGIIYDYKSSRKQYLEMYVEAINTNIGVDSKGRSSSQRLDDLLLVYSTNNILICEPDGPRMDKDHYDSIGVELDGNGTILATKENLTALYNDVKYPFGHGYCLAWYIINLV